MVKKQGQKETSSRKERKRGQGEGSIRTRKDGTREARLTIGVDPETGKQKQISKYFNPQRSPGVVSKGCPRAGYWRFR